MELPVLQLSQPPKDSRLLREADPLFIQELKDNMLKDPTAPGFTPFAVLCKDKQSLADFNPKYASMKSWEDCIHY